MMKVASWLAGAAAFLIAGAGGAQEKVAVVVPAVLDPAAPIAEGVRQQCNVQTSVGTQVFERVSQRYPGAAQVQDASKAPPDTAVLKVTLTSVLGVGGGGWSGRKSMTVRAELLQGTKLLIAHTLSRQSGGGVLGGVSGTCAIMDRIAEALGRDVGAWLPAALLMVQMEAAQKQDPPKPQEPQKQ